MGAKERPMKDKNYKKLRNEQIKTYLEMYTIAAAIVCALILLGWLL